LSVKHQNTFISPLFDQLTSGKIIMNSHQNFARALSLALLLIVCSAAPSFAQEEKKQEKRAPLIPTGLSLEVNTKEGPVSYQSIPGESFGGRYRRLASWQPTADAPEAETFELIYVMEGDAVRVKAYAWIGKFADKKEMIGNYLLPEGAKVTIEDMARFGYEPMELTIVKVKPAPLVLPEATSKVQSVAVVGVELKPGNFPSYKLTLRNLSGKDITHLEIKTYRESRLALIKWPRDEFNRTLVKAGESAEFILNTTGNGQKTQDGFSPSPAKQIEVTTVIFSDKSYEGDVESAARFIAALHGQKIQLTRALPLFKHISDAQGADASVRLENLKQQVSLLERSASQEMIDEVFAAFPGRTPQWNEGLKSYMEGGLDQVRKELLSDIEKYVRGNDGAGSKSFGAWSSDFKQKYEAWLSRL
jgi:hypothetical protein